MKIKYLLIMILLNAACYATFPVDEEEVIVKEVVEEEKTVPCTCVAYKPKYKKKQADISEFFYFNLDNSLNINLMHGSFSPFIGIGCRQIYGKNGVDWNAGIELIPLIRTKFRLWSYSLNGNYIRYFKSVKKDKNYIAWGLSFVGLYTPHYFYLTRGPSFIIGKQIYDRKRIYITQIKVNWPNWTSISVRDHYYRIPRVEQEKRLWSANVFITTGIAF